MKLTYYVDVYPWSTPHPPTQPFIQPAHALSEREKSAKRYRVEIELPDPEVDAVVQATVTEEGD